MREQHSHRGFARRPLLWLASILAGLFLGLALSGVKTGSRHRPEHLEWSMGGQHLRHLDLRGWDLRGANLYRARLHNVDLRNADLRGANLREAEFHRVDLRGARLEGADLTGVRWTEHVQWPSSTGTDWFRPLASQ